MSLLTLLQQFGEGCAVVAMFRAGAHMPGGIGAVSESVQSAGAGRERELAGAVHPNEIFFHLDVHNVYFDRAHGMLYFVDSPTGAIAQILVRALQGMGCRACFEQLHLDAHGLFDAARRICLSESQSAAVLIALRLAGVRATIRQRPAG